MTALGPVPETGAVTAAAPAPPASAVTAAGPAPETGAVTGATTGRLPLSSLLSQVLVAFIIECDNEFERRMPHSTTSHGRTPGAPWLVSMPMWSNCLRFVGEEPITVAELERRARTGTNLDGMRRWGYIDVRPDPGDRRARPPRRDLTVRATAAGLQAQQVWWPLPGVIEKRWQQRFGREALGDLREWLLAVAARLDGGLPDCLPILGHGLRTIGPWRESPPEDVSGLSLPALLSRVLLAFAVEFERGSDVALAISANLLRVLDRQGVRTRDLPLLAGVSKQAISMATGIAGQQGLAAVEPDPAATRGKVVRLTPGGRQAQDSCRRLLAAIEDGWRGALRPGRHPRPAPGARSPGGRAGRAALTVVAGAATLPRRVAGVGPRATDAAAPPHGAAPRRLPRRQLNRPAPGRSAAGADPGVADDARHVPPRLLGLVEG